MTFIKPRTCLNCSCITSLNETSCLSEHLVLDCAVWAPAYRKNTSMYSLGSHSWRGWSDSCVLPTIRLHSISTFIATVAAPTHQARACAMCCSIIHLETMCLCTVLCRRRGRDLHKCLKGFKCAAMEIPYRQRAGICFAGLQTAVRPTHE